MNNPISILQASKEYPISRQQLNQACNEGRLNFSMVKGRKMVYKEDVAKYVANNQAQGQTATPDFQDYRKLKIEFEAKLKELQYKTESGELVKADDVYADFAKGCQVIGQALDNLHYVIVARLGMEDKKNWLAACREEIDKFRLQVNANLEKKP